MWHDRQYVGYPIRLFLNSDKWRIACRFENFNCKERSLEKRAHELIENMCMRVFFFVRTFPFPMYSCEQPRGHLVEPSTVGGLIERAALLRIAPLLYATVLIFMRPPMTL